MRQEPITQFRPQPNKVELIGYYGTDETIALSAWTSTSRDLTDEKDSAYRNLSGACGSMAMKRLSRRCNFISL